ncbi:glycosyltransferase family 39 protein [archaeon]|nr:glycosyltransferase family 39 protein [archaeon]
MNYKKILNNEKFIIISLFLFAFLLRIIFKNAGLFHFDSYADARTVEQIFERGSMQYSYAYGAPTAMILTFLFFMIDKLIFGATQAENTYFFVNFLTAALSVALIYIIAKKITRNTFVGIVSALIFAVNPVFLAVTTYPKTHSISIFFALLGGLLLLKAADKNSLKLLILSGLSFGLNIGTRPDGVLYLIPFILLYIDPKIKNKALILKKDRLTLKKILTFIISVIIPPLILFLPWFLDKGIADFLRALNPQTELRLDRGESNLGTAFSNITTALTWLGIAFAALGSLYLYIKNRKLVLITLLLWFALFFFSLGLTLPENTSYARFFIPTMIPLTILAATGLRAIYRKNKLITLLVILFLLGSTFAVAYPIISYRHEHSGTKDFAIYAEENTEENAVVMTNDLGFFIQYYGNRTIIIHPRTGNLNEIDEFMEELKEYVDQGIQIYSTEEGFGIDPGQGVLNAITQEYDIILIGESDNEWYGGSSLELKVYKEKLFKLVPKSQ